MGGVSRRIYSVQVRSLPLRLSHTVILQADGRVLLEASHGGLGMYLPSHSPMVALAVNFPRVPQW